MLDQKVIFLVILLAIIYFVSSKKEYFGSAHEAKVKLFDGRCTPVNNFPFYGFDKNEFADKCSRIFNGDSDTCKSGLLSGRKCKNVNKNFYKEWLKRANEVNDLYPFDISRN
jgi:hypothetical protein